jgi:four helix bundle protein
MFSDYPLDVKGFRFLDWKVYKDAQSVFFDIRRLVSTIGSQDKMYLRSQALRSSLSVVLNIAEGSGKSSEKELVRFLDIALGSLYETRAALDILQTIGAASDEEVLVIEGRMGEIARQLGGLRKSAKKKLIP